MAAPGSLGTAYDGSVTIGFSHFPFQDPMRFRSLALAASCIALVNSCGTTPPPEAAGPLANIDTIVVIYAENRSFDNLYGMFPGANGVASAFPNATRQV